MPGRSRPRNRKHTLNRRCIGMANPAGLDAYADIAGLRIDKGLAGQFKFAGADGLNGSVGHFGLGHFPLLCWTNDASRTSAPDDDRYDLAIPIPSESRNSASASAMTAASTIRGAVTVI